MTLATFLGLGLEVVCRADDRGAAEHVDLPHGGDLHRGDVEGRSRGRSNPNPSPNPYPYPNPNPNPNLTRILTLTLTLTLYLTRTRTRTRTLTPALTLARRPWKRRRGRRLRRPTACRRWGPYPYPHPHLTLTLAELLP